MNSTIQSRRIQTDFNIHDGRLNLSTETALRQGDIITFRENLEGVVAVVAPLTDKTSLPAHVLVLERGSENIYAQTYIFNQENGQGYLIQSSPECCIVSSECRKLYDQILKEAGQ